MTNTLAFDILYLLAIHVTNNTFTRKDGKSSMAVKKVLVTDRNTLPEKKISVNQEWMFEWLEKYGKLEDVEWYQSFCEANKVTFRSNLDGNEYDVPDWAKVRAEFLKRYFPDAYPKRTQARKKQEKYSDRLAALKARKAMERDQVTIEEATDASNKSKKK